MVAVCQVAPEAAATSPPPLLLLEGSRHVPETPTFSVVIPLFNKQDAIERTLLSVIGQTRPPDELIIVDDGSSDQSVDIAQQLLSRPGLTFGWQVVSQENAGVAAARNAGAEKSGSLYIAFLDADDEWLPGYLAELEKLALQFSSATVLTIRSAMIGTDGRIAGRPSALGDQFFGVVDRPVDTYRRGYGLVNCSSVAIRRDAWYRAGGFPTGAPKGEDTFMWLKLGSSETFAHSGTPQSIWHDEHSGYQRRRGVVPYHLEYFLGTDEGRRHLDNPDIATFLQANIVMQTGVHRLVGDKEIVRSLCALSAALPMFTRARCLAVSKVPRPVLRLVSWCRKRARGLRRPL